MLNYICLILFTTICAFGVEKERSGLAKANAAAVRLEREIVVGMLLLAVYLAFSCFAGMRTRYNDTWTYIHEYESIKPGWERLKELDSEAYTGFAVYQTVLKTLGANWHFYLLITALITNAVYIYYYSKYSKTFALTVLLYAVLGPFIFSMAAIKQILAMSISFIAISFLIQKRYVMFVLLTLLAATFHPYIFLTLVLPLFTKSVWTKQTWLIILSVLILFVFMEEFMSSFLEATDSVGREYSVEEMFDHGINPLRVIVDSIPAVLSYSCRNRINKSKNRALILGCNMMLIQVLLTYMALFVNPIYSYRVGIYFSSMNAVIVPWMLVYGLPRSKYKTLFIIGYITFFTACELYSGFGSIPFTADKFGHVGISEMFNSALPAGMHVY